MDRVFDALVTAAAADVARHRFAYLIVRGFGIIRQQCGSLHDLAGLAVTALRDVYLAPRFLNRVITRGVKTFDGGDLSADHVGNGGDACAHGLLVDDNGACSAEGLATAEFCARQSSRPYSHASPP